MAQTHGHAHSATSAITGAGNGLFAATDIAAGELIFSLERPAVAVLDTKQLDTVCSNCFASSEDRGVKYGDVADVVTVKACTGCRVLRYCSKQCQAASWTRSHKAECKIFKATSTKGILPHAARALLQLMTLSPTPEASPFRDMSSHLTEIAKAGGEVYQNLLVLSTGIHQYSGTKLPLPFLQQCLATIFTNSFTLLSPTFDPLGLALDPFPCSINHSCTPNSFLVFDGPALSVRTLTPIASNTELTVSYIDTSLPFRLRQNELSTRYHFRCRCPVCTLGIHTYRDRFLADPETLPPRWDKDIRWPPGALSGFTYASNPSSSNDHYISDSAAGASLTATQWLAFKQFSLAKTYSLPLPPDKTEEAVDAIQLALSLCLQTHIWPEHRQPLAGVRTWLWSTFLSFKMGLLVYFKINPVVYEQSWHPIRVVHVWAMVNVLLNLLDPSAASIDQETELRAAGVDFGVVVYGLLLECVDNVSRSHGKESRFAREVRRKFEEVRTDMTRGDAGSLTGIKSRIEAQWGILRKLADAKELEMALG